MLHFSTQPSDQNCECGSGQCGYGRGEFAPFLYASLRDLGVGRGICDGSSCSKTHIIDLCQQKYSVAQVNKAGLYQTVLDGSKQTQFYWRHSGHYTWPWIRDNKKAWYDGNGSDDVEWKTSHDALPFAKHTCRNKCQMPTTEADCRMAAGHLGLPFTNVGDVLTGIKCYNKRKSTTDCKAEFNDQCFTRGMCKVVKLSSAGVEDVHNYLMTRPPKCSVQIAKLSPTSKRRVV